jgi:hypothetical protein
MSTKDFPHTEIEILFGIESEEARERHDHGITTMISPIGFNLIYIHESIKPHIE